MTVPLTLEDYCIKTKVKQDPEPVDMADFYDDDYDIDDDDDDDDDEDNASDNGRCCVESRNTFDAFRSAVIIISTTFLLILFSSNHCKQINGHYVFFLCIY